MPKVNRELLKDLKAGMANEQPETSSKQETQPVMQRRPRRRSSISGPRNVLRLNKQDPNYKYRVVNDVGDRVASMEEIGYEVVKDPELRLGDRRAGKVGSVGTPVEAYVGQGTKAVVMRIPKELYEQDQADKQLEVDSIEDTMFRRAKREESDYGKFKYE